MLDQEPSAFTLKMLVSSAKVDHHLWEGQSNSPRKQGSRATHQVWEGVWQLTGMGGGVATHQIWERVIRLIMECIQTERYPK